MTTPSPDEAKPLVGPIRAWYSLVILTLVTLFAFIDRQVLLLLAEPIKKALALSDFQLGLLQGTAVAIFAGLAAYPLAWLADRYNRRVVLMGSIIFWSLAVVGCGLAQNFEQLVLAAALVGAGEAGLSPLTFSLIPDWFNRKQRQIANSVFALAVTSGGSVAMIACGLLIAQVELLTPTLPHGLNTLESWRLTFFAAALPAPLMLLLLLTISFRRPSRAPEQLSSAAPTHKDSLSFGSFLRANARALAQLFLAFGCSNFGFAAIASWLVVILMRYFDQTPLQVGTAMGSALLVATPIAFLSSIALTRLYGPSVGVALPLRITRYSFVAAAILVAAMKVAPSAEVMYGLIFLIYATNSTAGMVLPTAIQNLSPPDQRARLIALQGIVSIFFAASAPALVGLLSDRLAGDPNGLMTAALALAVPALLLATVLLWISERNYVTMANASALAESRRSG